MTLRRILIALACATFTACASHGGVEIVRDAPPLDRSRVARITADDFAAADFTSGDGTTLAYRLLAPQRIEAGRRYPLIVQFHNSGGIGTDNRAQIEKDASARAWALPAIRADYPAFVLAPQFSGRSANYDDPKAPHVAFAAPQLSAALQLVDAFVSTHPVDPQRIYATGFSMGGSTAWLAALARPGFFAAVVPVGAIAPDRTQAPMLARLPILAFHGDADTENPIASDRQMVAAIRAAGGRNVRLREYVGLEHQPPGDFIPGRWWRDWLFAQRREAH